MQPKTIQLPSQKIAYYESAGTGSPVMLIHGNSASGGSFRHQIENEFGRKHRVVAMDLPATVTATPPETWPRTACLAMHRW